MADGGPRAVIKINAITVPENSGDELAQPLRRAGRRRRRPGRLRGFRAAPPDRRSLAVARGHPLARRGGVQQVGLLAGVRPRSRRRRSALAPRRPGLGVVGAVVLRGGRRFGRKGRRPGTDGVTLTPGGGSARPGPGAGAPATAPTAPAQPARSPTGHDEGGRPREGLDAGRSLHDPLQRGHAQAPSARHPPDRRVHRHLHPRHGGRRSGRDQPLRRRRSHQPYGRSGRTRRRRHGHDLRAGPAVGAAHQPRRHPRLHGPPRLQGRLGRALHRRPVGRRARRRARSSS